MLISLVLPALFLVSTLTTLTVEGLKKILDSTKIKYSSNVLAVIVSVIISVVICILYMIYNAVPFTFPRVCDIIIITFLGFLVATVGYDKVVQTITQILNKKSDNKK